jgi:allantoicase
MSEHRSEGRARSGAHGSDERSREEQIDMSEHRSEGRARSGAHGSDERSREEQIDMSERYLPDLAARELGGSVVAANDELFAGRENLIKAEAPVFQPHTFGPKGQLMDGWETRRRRTAGSDHAIVRLGCPGVLRRIVIDTAHFTGNFPAAASVDACGVDGYPSPKELAGVDWLPLVAPSTLIGDSVHEFDVEDEHRFTHVRLTIYPDGGVARLRVFGEVVADPRLLPPVVDLAALEHGGRVLDCSNAFYSSPNNLIKPGLARVMGDGWETARRRDDGNDWVSLRLACAGRPMLAEIDTTHFIGNAPGWASLTGHDGVTLLPRTRLQPDTRHRFGLPDSPELSTVRLDVFPDGGVGRLRLYGAPTEAGRAALSLRFANALPDGQLAGLLGGSATGSRPYPDPGALPEALLRSLTGPQP